MASLTLVVVVVVLVIFPYTVYSDEHKSCSRSCGVHNISHPFRLKDIPKHCGDKRYILSCEENQLILNYGSFGKYYVQSINYNNFTIRLLDFNLVNFSPPYYSLGLYNFSSSITSPSSSPYLFYKLSSYSTPSSTNYTDHILTKSVLYVSCPNWMEYSYISNCMSSGSYSQHGNRFYVGRYSKSLSELGMKDGCRVEFMYLTSLNFEDGNNSNISCKDFRRMMYYGFEFSWLNSICNHGWYAELDHYNQLHCEPGLLQREWILLHC